MRIKLGLGQVTQDSKSSEVQISKSDITANRGDESSVSITSRCSHEAAKLSKMKIEPQVSQNSSLLRKNTGFSLDMDKAIMTPKKTILTQMLKDKI